MLVLFDLMFNWIVLETSIQALIFAFLVLYCCQV